MKTWEPKSLWSHSTCSALLCAICSVDGRRYISRSVPVKSAHMTFSKETGKPLEMFQASGTAAFPVASVRTPGQSLGCLACQDLSPDPLAAGEGSSFSLGTRKCISMVFTSSEPLGRKNRSFSSAVHIWPGECAAEH